MEAGERSHESEMGASLDAALSALKATGASHRERLAMIAAFLDGEPEARCMALAEQVLATHADSLDAVGLLAAMGRARPELGVALGDELERHGLYRMSLVFGLPYDDDPDEWQRTVTIADMWQSAFGHEGLMATWANGNATKAVVSGEPIPFIIQRNPFIIRREMNQPSPIAQMRGLVVSGRCEIVNYTGQDVLPEGCRIGGGLSLSHCDFTTLPEGLRVDGGLSITACRRLKALPDGLRVGQDLFVKDTAGLMSIGSDTVIGGNAGDFYYKKFTTIGERVRIGGDLNLARTGVVTLPDDLSVGGELSMMRCEAWDGVLPKGATVSAMRTGALGLTTGDDYRAWHEARHGDAPAILMVRGLRDSWTRDGILEAIRVCGPDAVLNEAVRNWNGKAINPKTRILGWTALAGASEGAIRDAVAAWANDVPPAQFTPEILDATEAQATMMALLVFGKDILKTDPRFGLYAHREKA